MRDIYTTLSIMENKIRELEALVADAPMVDDPLPRVAGEAEPSTNGWLVRQLSANTVSVQGGQYQSQYNLFFGPYAATTVTIPLDTAGTAWEIYIRYDLGISAEHPPVWVGHGGTGVVQSAATLPSVDADIPTGMGGPRYANIHIATITWDPAKHAITGITQHHTGLVPCPDTRAALDLRLIADATAGDPIPCGWRAYTEGDGRALVATTDPAKAAETFGGGAATVDITDPGHSHMISAENIDVASPGASTFYQLGECATTTTGITASLTEANRWSPSIRVLALVHL